jgi:hypothetical protein
MSKTGRITATFSKFQLPLKTLSIFNFLTREKFMKIWQKTQKVFHAVIIPAFQQRLSILLLAALFLGVSTASAQEKSADQWQFDTTVYLWGATVKATTATGDPLLINFGTIIKNLDFAGMVTMGARKNKFSMLADVIYMDLSDSKRREGEFLGQSITGKVEIGMQTLVLNLIGGYNLIDSGKNVFDVAAGARYLDVAVDGTIKINDQKRKSSASDHTWDAVIGIKGRHNYSDGHYLNYYADVGGGDSKITWQAAANFSYDYKKFTGLVGYRYLKWNFSNDAPALDDIVIHGPYLGIKLRF